MNYKNNAIREIQEFTKEFPEYSLGETLYSVLRLLKIQKLSNLLELSDEEIFSAVEKAKQEEKEIA